LLGSTGAAGGGGGGGGGGSDSLLIWDKLPHDEPVF